MTKETGTARELNLKPGDIFKWSNIEYTVTSARELPEWDMFSGEFLVDTVSEFGRVVGFIFDSEILTIVSRENKPTKKYIALFSDGEYLGPTTKEEIETFCDENTDLSAFLEYVYEVNEPVEFKAKLEIIE